MPSLDDLRKRISSVKSTQKITKAMNMVAAAKLRRAQEMAEKGRPFSDNMNFIIIPRMTIKRRYENKGIDLIKLIDDVSYYDKVKKNINSRGSLEFKDR